MTVQEQPMSSHQIDSALVDELEQTITVGLEAMADQLALKLATYELPAALPSVEALITQIQEPGRPSAELLATLLSFHAMAKDRELAVTVDHAGWWPSFTAEFWPSLLLSIEEIRAEALANEHDAAHDAAHGIDLGLD